MKGAYPRDELARVPADCDCHDVRRLNVPLLDAERHLSFAGSDPEHGAHLAVANQKVASARPRLAQSRGRHGAIGPSRLLVDLDPQGNATTGSGVNKSKLERTIYHVLLGLGDASNIRLRVDSGYDLIPANRELAGAEVELVALPNREAGCAPRWSGSAANTISSSSTVRPRSACSRSMPLRRRSRC